jgi:hypothetical protein
MTGERSMFTSLDKENGTRENIVFGDDGKGKIIGLGKIGTPIINLSLMFFLSIH